MVHEHKIVKRSRELYARNPFTLSLNWATPVSLQKILPSKDTIFTFARAATTVVDPKEVRRLSKVSRDNVGLSRMRGVTNRLQVNFPDGERSNHCFGERKELELKTAGELMEIIAGFGFEDAVIGHLIVSTDIPSLVEHYPEYQGTNHILLEQQSCGNLVHVYRRLFRRRLFNPYDAMKANLFTQGHITTGKDPVLRRLRGTLRTRAVLPSNPSIIDTVGVDGFLEHHHKLALGLTMNPDDFWLDAGLPRSAPVENGVKGVVQLFHLVKHQKLMALEPPTM